MFSSWSGKFPLLNDCIFSQSLHYSFSEFSGGNVLNPSPLSRNTYFINFSINCSSRCFHCPTHMLSAFTSACEPGFLKTAGILHEGFFLPFSFSFLFFLFFFLTVWKLSLCSVSWNQPLNWENSEMCSIVSLKVHQGNSVPVACSDHLMGG